ncbi:RhoGAP-domain-containing protein [Pluteus cervinus]|uniref:RhoGAP-domain-containing protein n=1 Tax=Pluteus cervinus TaxID=181527 RepID=A0ACD3BBR8_9AGAR|nr:RhoGAP-domain-containing protein [Pluteus cervinus]
MDPSAHSVALPVQVHHNDPSESMSLDDRICPGCRLSLVSEQGGLVVAFGQSFFHVDCFKCAKCGNKVTADTNLLLLSDGSPICANCSYSCNVCHQPILDEAIMTGDDSYHAHCFKCKVCKNRIDELVFAKTTQGIYCMNCHNERMIKIRRYTQKKAEREREKALNSSTSSRSREQDARHHPEISGHGSTSKSIHNSRPQEQPSTPLQKREFNDLDIRSPLVPQPRLQSPTPVTPHPPPHPLPIVPKRSEPLASNAPQITQWSALPSAGAWDDPDGKRPYDDGVRPLNVLFQQKDRTSLEPQPKFEGLTVNTSRRDKRRSINPGLVLDTNGSLPSSNNPVSPGLTPLSASFPGHPSYNPTSRDPPPLSPTGRVPSHPQVANSQRPHSASSSHSLSSHRATSPAPTHPDANADHTIVFHRTSAPTSYPSSPQASRSYSYPDPSKNQVSNPEQARFRTTSPTHHVDVPDTVDSETDHEVDHRHFDRPPSLPPKGETDDAVNGHAEIGSGDAFESSPVERTSHATYIAPALPPIRFSLNTGDFSQLFNNANVPPSLKSLENLAKRTDSQSASQNTPSLSTSHPTGPRQIVGTSPRSQSPQPLGSPAIRQGTGTLPEVLPSSPKVTSVFSPPPLVNGSDTYQTHDGPTHGLTRATTSITLTEPGSSVATTIQTHSPDAVQSRVKEAVKDAKERNAQQLKLDRMFVEAILETLESRKADYMDLKSRLDGVKRTSKQYMDGLTVAQTEYDKELRARRDAEAEVTRLRVLLSGQAARLTALSSESRRHELRQQHTKELHENLSGLEQDLSKLKVERDMTLAEVEELSASKSSQDIPSQNLGRSLTTRLDKIRVQYQRDLIPLNQQREALTREIAELRAVRDVFLEETTALNARNEELAQLGAAYARRVDSLPEGIPRPREIDIPRGSLDKPHYAPPQSTPALSSSTTSSSTLAISDETADSKYYKVSKTDAENPTPSKGKFKWPGAKASKDVLAAAPLENKGRGRVEHNFQQLSILRFTRCDHCGDKMWGSQLRCTACNTAVHVRCIGLIQSSCSSNHNTTKDDSQPLPPSMFGRDLIEQVRADTREGEERWIPVIVEKCVDAVDVLALDYEGIYRKTGGSGQSKVITQLFESGDYTSFDLRDQDRFNDICSVTSVLKTYFRSLPTPLLTFDLHDDFMTAVHTKDAVVKHHTLLDLINRLPKEHYCTLRLLMLHLARIREQSDQNLMNARNLGIVFGPTLMRSRDPGAEFSDMAGKALSIEWMVENATNIFS